jgi:hypothetical protein
MDEVRKLGLGILNIRIASVVSQMPMFLFVSKTLNECMDESTQMDGATMYISCLQVIVIDSELLEQAQKVEMAQAAVSGRHESSQHQSHYSIEEIIVRTHAVHTVLSLYLIPSMLSLIVGARGPVV